MSSSPVSRAWNVCRMCCESARQTAGTTRGATRTTTRQLRRKLDVMPLHLGGTVRAALRATEHMYISLGGPRGRRAPPAFLFVLEYEDYSAEFACKRNFGS